MDSAKKLNAEDVIKYDADFLRAFKEVRIPMGKQLKNPKTRESSRSTRPPPLFRSNPPSLVLTVLPSDRST